MSSETKKGAILQSYGEPKPADLRDAFIGRFVIEAARKFDAGQAEHDGRDDRCNLIENISVEKLKEEVIDLWFYILALEEKLKK
jgi:hypothetical protein